MNDPPAKFTFFYCTPSGKKNQFNTISEFPFAFRKSFVTKNAHKKCSQGFFRFTHRQNLQICKKRRTLFFI